MDTKGCINLFQYMIHVLHAGNKCFKVVEQLTWDQGYTWANAQNQCKAGPGVAPDLASVQSAAENGSVAQILLLAYIVLMLCYYYGNVVLLPY